MTHVVLEGKGHVGKLCISSLYKSAPSELETFIPKEKDGAFSLGDALGSFSPLLEMVFEFLNRRELNNAKLVSLKWNDAATRVLQKRTSPSWLGFCIHPLCLHVSPGFTYNSASVGILAHNLDYIKFRNRVCVHDSSDSSQTTFSKYIKDQLMCNNLNHLILQCVVTCNKKCSKSPCALHSDNCDSAFQCLLLPKIPKIDISLVCVRRHKDGVSNLKKSNDLIRCALVFTNFCSVKVFDAFCDNLLFGEAPESLALGGGIVKHVKAALNDKNPKLMNGKEELMCMLFTQKRGDKTEFDAYSRIFKGTSDEFEADVLKFKSEILLRNHGVVFRFCCCAKDEGALETNVITKHFSNYQLLGMEVYGEIGWNFPGGTYSETGDKINSSAKETPLKKRAKLTKIRGKSILYSCSTVLVVITWGHKIS